MKVKLIANLELASLCYKNKQRYPFLLDSVNHNKNNRYSILFANPLEEIRLNNLNEFDFLSTLSAKINKSNNSAMPFSGGWFVYLSYELIGQIEPILINNLYLGDNQAIAIAVRIPTAIIVDHLFNKTYLIDESDNAQRIEQVLTDIDELTKIPNANITGNLSQEEESKFLHGVEKSREYIIAGDVFQVNLSRQWQYDITSCANSVQIYQALKKSNPAPFSALAQFSDFSIISSSPERLFNVDGDTIQTRPIAGTHPRGDKNNDELIKEQLISHPKERSEHIMLLDLERNDLGRVCKYGSVHVNEIMMLETYPYVHHIVSNIIGKLRNDITIEHLLKALFPGGTITGCPKVRCMQIISELEKMPRQAYTGSIGYISNNNKMDFNILIRTISKQNKTLTFRAGGGIVFDSIAERELEETLHKAQGILSILN